METTRICKQCSRRLPIERFRLLRGARKTDKRGRQHTCMECDSINALFRRLVLKTDLSDSDTLKLNKCVEVYKTIYRVNPNCTMPTRAKEHIGLGTTDSSDGTYLSAFDNILGAYSNTVASEGATPEGTTQVVGTSPAAHEQEQEDRVDLIAEVKSLTVTSSSEDIDHVLGLILDIDASRYSEAYLKELSDLENVVDILVKRHSNLGAAEKLQELSEELFNLG